MVATDNAIYVSDKAKAKVVKLMEDAGVADDPSYFLRVGVVGGGCSGLSYKLDFDNETKPMDQVFEDNGVKVVTDLKSFLYLVNTEPCTSAVLGLPPEHPTLPSLLQAAGYRTALTGKWHLGYPPAFGSKPPSGGPRRLPGVHAASIFRPMPGTGSSAVHSSIM